ncbi:LOW QUALITY PROTEIN: putative 1-phosphatidylinositol-3-phosphate 5-kinase FAB1D [Dioscorea cayenensis subsp. rotundata]|uniref:1-phosphatidylinositol-3-phosphate 5-kinase n=1 Tax=Dioscorea cayennensis subsp. rotundata TaxID=55577 RepID=A0AB40B7A4_DIOCR|nr:LOW QUALITY PROTEIN: putative 1-phosphatidylinositol-3-phosphate 5-kinase FAB1D [Dioscorea cayenensis subsp. rotundata]
MPMGNTTKNIEVQDFHGKNILNGVKHPMFGEQVNSSTVLNHDASGGEKVELHSKTHEDAQSTTRAGDDSDGTDVTSESAIPRFLCNIETDPLIWIPPEPEEGEADSDSVANIDDDDDYSDGTKWGQPASLSSFDEEYSSKHNYKERRQKAMMEAMNGQFKILVSRFLASEGISFSDGEAGESWLDVMTSLSWEAALLIKPDASQGQAMDPGIYVKVKCVASGQRSQSQVIKGWVFKKNTAHKHMPTKYKNPRLLLLKGVLGHSATSLSSFVSMEQERDSLKSIIEMIETCQPNVVLVEKTVSRDIQESLLTKGITLAFDMKLTRLERIARCTGSEIISSADIIMKPKLKQCEYFHIEKFTEDYNCSGEGGRRPIKTLMFLEGFSKPLGCTILLRGAPSDELKKIKRVIHYTVFAAYHLILETSFFADQRAFFSDLNVEVNKSLSDNQNSGGYAVEPYSSPSDIEASAGSIAPPVLEIQVTDGSPESFLSEGEHLISNLDAKNPSLPGFGPGFDTTQNLKDRDVFFKPNSGEVQQMDAFGQHLSGRLLSSVSGSLRRYLGGGFPPLTSDSVLPYIGFKDEVNHQSIDIMPVSPSPQTLSHEIKANGKISQLKSDDEVDKSEKMGFSSDSIRPFGNCMSGEGNKVGVQNRDDIESVLDPQSILVLLSSQCISKRTVCEQSHLSRIKYYGNFDVSLGRFLQDILLSQKHSCSACGEPPEGHIYRYTHQNGNITVLVKRLSSKLTLSGEDEGKIWMWTRCLRCEHESGIPRTSQRVVMSTAACGLSFGKFLELSFSSHSAANRLSRCGHSLHRDCLRFFGLGSKVAMFRYSSVEIYAACKPPPVIDFSNTKGLEWLQREAKDMLLKGDKFFLEVRDSLEKLRTRFSSSLMKQSLSLGSVKEFHEIEEMLVHDKADFEATLVRTTNCGGQIGRNGHEIVDVSWLSQELLLLLYVWDHRLNSLRMYIQDGNANHEPDHEFSKEDVDATSSSSRVKTSASESDGKGLEVSVQVPIDVVESLAPNGDLYPHSIRTASEFDSAENSGNTTITVSTSNLSGDSLEGPASLVDHDISSKPYELSSVTVPILDPMQVDLSNSSVKEPMRHIEKIDGSGLKTEETEAGGLLSATSLPKEQHFGSSYKSFSFRAEGPEGWVWSSFSELQKELRKDLHGGYLQKFSFIYSFRPLYLSPIGDMIYRDMDKLHFPVGLGGNVISVCEDEISSIIACALALSESQCGLLGSADNMESWDCKGEADKSVDSTYGLKSDISTISYWSSTGSIDERMRTSHSYSSLISDELSASISDVLSSADRMLASDNQHPEIPVGVGKVAGKSKYSVVCINAKQFYDLRKRCCPSELAYISSLSRCKKWDAQGGKSKAFFAKSMDERFIIKQIKKTELDSFLKFAPDYFNHITGSLDSGSQTCLAKILGIYQVRQNRSGKEIKIDLMVMENLLFGRNISRTYDLKGAVFSRYISDTNDSEKVLLDQNFVEDMCVSPIYVGGRTKHLLQRAIWNDTSFLTSINVMDYSLLVGVDKQRRELVFGIIDYLRQYTWDKQLETWVKTSLVVPKNALPTVISPKEYKKRFRNFMTKYFLTVPDTWCQEKCSGPCRFCSDSCRNASFSESVKLPER